MNREAAVVFPHQLFWDHPSLDQGAPVFLVEEDRFFTDFRFHKKKILLHRASLMYYKESLEGRGFEVAYTPNQEGSTLTALFEELRERGITGVRLAEICDRPLERSLTEGLKEMGVGMRVEESPAFLTPTGFIEEFFKELGRYSMTTFYRAQRRRLNVLMEGKKPAGGKWSFDPENRKRLPKDMKVPSLPTIREDDYVREAKRYVESRFPDNPGSTEGFIYPVTHEGAKLWLDDFISRRLAHFGDYQDSMREAEPFLFHSLLSPLLNVGLLTPREVVEKTLAHSEERDVPMNSLEGFIRQIIGWREFMRAVYVLEGERERSANFWGHRNEVPGSLYTGSTGIDPVDAVVRRVMDHAYAHHIERLMVLGNFMNLCGIDPEAVYRWFMELFIDAYDWVMVPNVYGMSQYADGGLITTKPYVGGSNYIRRMGDFPKGEWSEILDGLFWRFLDLHRDVFEKNPRTRVLTVQLDRMGEDRLGRHRAVAEAFLDRTFKEAPRRGGERSTRLADDCL